jgi:hypothetical protein
MHATVRRYEGVDASRTAELSRKIDETLMPRLSELPGFDSYYVIEAGNGVMTSVGLFETSAQADESTRLASGWVQEEKLETLLPNPPKITSGEVIAHKNNGV